MSGSDDAEMADAGAVVDIAGERIPVAVSWRVVVLCALMCLFDGFDMVVALMNFSVTTIMTGLVIPMVVALCIVLKFRSRFPRSAMLE